MKIVCNIKQHLIILNYNYKRKYIFKKSFKNNFMLSMEGHQTTSIFLKCAKCAKLLLEQHYITKQSSLFNSLFFFKIKLEIYEKISQNPVEQSLRVTKNVIDIKTIRVFDNFSHCSILTKYRIVPVVFYFYPLVYVESLFILLLYPPSML